MAVLSNLVKEMGLRGMYTGTVSTFMRDVPFSIVYFSLYGICKCAGGPPPPPPRRGETHPPPPPRAPAGPPPPLAQPRAPRGGQAAPSWYLCSSQPPRRHPSRSHSSPPPPSRTDWTRLVPPPVLTGHVSSLQGHIPRATTPCGCQEPLKGSGEGAGRARHPLRHERRARGGA